MDEALCKRIDKLESDLEHFREKLESSDSNYHHNYFKLVQTIAEKEAELQSLLEGQMLYKGKPFSA